MDMKPAPKRLLSKSHASARYNDQSNNTRNNDHRQTMNSVVIEERKRVGRQKASEPNTRERDLLHRNIHRSPEKEKRQAYDNDTSLENLRIENTHNNMAFAYRGSGIKLDSINLDKNLASKEHRLRADMLPLDTRRESRSLALLKSKSDRSLMSPTGTLKPPLKPRRSRRSKSVTSSTKSTSSTTYVSSDSSDGEKDDDSIETPDLRIGAFDGQSSSWSTSSPLAPYDSSDDYGRLAMVPYQESKKKKKTRSRQSSSKLTPSNSDDDDIDPFFNLGDDDFANVYNLSSSDTDTSDVDLDEMIAESSARWKTTINSIVTNTVTATQGNLVVHNATAGSLSSAIVPSRIERTGLREQLPMNHKAESNVIEKQQAEIESLRAALKAQRYHTKFSSEMLVLPETTEFEAPSDYKFRNFSSQGTEDIDCVPLEHIEVNHDASDPNSSNYWQDDLTVWSGFNTVTGGMDGISPLNDDNGEKGCGKPPVTKRPDAASTSGASALNGVPVRVVKDMKVDLSSEMTSSVRKAVYSGTINAHTRQPEGQGTFRFTETGDMYQGEVLAGHMHGAGTYTFGRTNKKSSSKSKRPKELKGTFEYNVFIG